MTSEVMILFTVQVRIDVQRLTELLPNAHATPIKHCRRLDP